MIKSLLKSLLPKPFVRKIRQIKQRTQDKRNTSRTAREVFSEIYKDGHWGARSDGSYCSGSGSANQSITSPYIEMIKSYLKSIGSDKIVVDLGCGDMEIGKNFLDHCASYIGVDVVPDLISLHNETYKNNNANFFCLDIVEDELPEGDVCFVRQVLQHLSNDQISGILSKLSMYKVCFITEHYPSDNPEIEPNKDIIQGSRIRVYANSGVYLNKPPFNISNESMELMLEVPGQVSDNIFDSGVIRTYKIDWQTSL